MKNWIDLGSDVCWENHGGRWGRQDPKNSGVWYVIRFDDLADCCGNDYIAAGMDRYQANVLRVSLLSLSLETINDALRGCGLDLGDIAEEYQEVALVECLVLHGTYAPMGTFSDPSYPMRARAAARREVEFLMSSSEACEARLDRPVNKIGTTAREFGEGDILAGLRRYHEQGKHGTDTAMDVMFRLCGHQL